MTSDMILAPDGYMYSISTLLSLSSRTSPMNPSINLNNFISTIIPNSVKFKQLNQGITILGNICPELFLKEVPTKFLYALKRPVSKYNTSFVFDEFDMEKFFSDENEELLEELAEYFVPLIEDTTNIKYRNLLKMLLALENESLFELLIKKFNLLDSLTFFDLIIDFYVSWSNEFEKYIVKHYLDKIIELDILLNHKFFKIVTFIGFNEINFQELLIPSLKTIDALMYYCMYANIESTEKSEIIILFDIFSRNNLTLDLNTEYICEKLNYELCIEDDEGRPKEDPYKFKECSLAVIDVLVTRTDITTDVEEENLIAIIVFLIKKYNLILKEPNFFKKLSKDFGFRYIEIRESIKDI